MKPLTLDDIDEAMGGQIDVDVIAQKIAVSAAGANGARARSRRPSGPPDNINYADAERQDARHAADVRQGQRTIDRNARSGDANAQSRSQDISRGLNRRADIIEAGQRRNTAERAQAGPANGRSWVNGFYRLAARGNRYWVPGYYRENR